MKLKAKQFTSGRMPNKNNFTFFITLIFFSTSSLMAQYQFSFKNQSAKKITQSIENQLDITFNFNHSNLPVGNYTFSCSGSKVDILATSFSVLDRKIEQLDEAVYAIQSIEFPKEKKIAPLIIIGQVVDNYGNGLPFSTVWIPDLERVFETNQAGYFKIKGFFSPHEKVEFRYLGCKPRSKTIAQLLSVKNARIVLQLQQHLLSEIIITGQTRSPTSIVKNVEEVVLLPDQLMPLAGWADKDVLAIAQLVPGMYSTDESATEIQTRGGPPDQTNFEWNGIQLYLANHFFGKISAINPFLVDRISIIKNGASAEHSGQASGTIIMQDANIVVDSFRGTLHSNLLYSNVGLNIPLWKNRAQLRLAWRKSYVQFFESITFNRFFDNTFQFGKVEEEESDRDLNGLDSLIDLKPKLSFQDFFGSLKVQMNPKDFLKFSFVKVENKFQYVKSSDELDSTPTDDLKDNNLGLGLQYKRNWTNQLTTEIQASASRFDYQYQYLIDPENITTTFEAFQENDLQQRTFQISQFYERPNWKFATGYKYEHWKYHLYSFNQNSNAVAAGIDDGLKAGERSLFLQGLWSGSPFWQVEAGIRYSDYALRRQKIWEPRLHASFFPFENWTLHAHYGRYHQSLNKEHITTTFRVANKFWILSNETDTGTFLNVVENEQFSTGLRYQKNNWELGLDFYKKYSDNIWTSAFDFNFGNNPFRFVDLKIKGIEFSMKYTNDWLSLFWTYDHIAESFTLEDGLISRTPFSQPHRLSLLQAFQWKNWQITTHWKFASGRSFLEPENIGTANQSSTILFPPILTGQSPIYHNLDFSLFYNFKTLKQKVTGQIGCSIFNVYNRENILKNEYFLSYRSSNPTINIQSTKGLPFTPNLVINLMF